MRVQELEKSYQASHNELEQASLIAEKKLKEKYHEIVSILLILNNFVNTY